MLLNRSTWPWSAGSGRPASSYQERPELAPLSAPGHLLASSTCDWVGRGEGMGGGESEPGEEDWSLQVTCRSWSPVGPDRAPRLRMGLDEVAAARAGRLDCKLSSV